MQQFIKVNNGSETKQFRSIDKAIRTLCNYNNKSRLTFEKAEKLLNAYGWKVVETDNPNGGDEQDPTPQKQEQPKQAPKPSGGMPSDEGLKQLANIIQPYIDLQHNGNKDFEVELERLHEIANKKLADVDKDLQKLVERAIDKVTRRIVLEVPEQPDVEIDTAHEMFEKMLRLVSLDLPTLLVGPAGSGKTSAGKQVAESLEMNFYPYSVGAQTSVSHLIGYKDARGEYQSTTLREAYENGGIYLLDELDAGNANVITTLNNLISGDMYNFPDGIVKKSKHFRIIASANTFGKGADRMYTGRNQLDAASLDRFVVLEWEYDNVFEDTLASNKEWTKYVQTAREAVAKHKIRHVVSPRATFYGEKMLAGGFSFEEVLAMVLFKGGQVSENDKVKILNYVKQNFKEKISENANVKAKV